MSDELIDRILVEINKTGFPLELKVSHLLKSRGYYVNQSVYYMDQDENKARELDIKAINNKTYLLNPEDIKPNSISNSIYIRNWLVIECKKSENKPWVFLSSDRDTYDDNDLIELLLRNYKENIPFSYAEIAKIKSVHPFTKFSKVARSFFEAFKGSESSEAIFKALTTVVKSSLYFSRNDDKEDIWILYPIVVFDGRMFDATINEIGEVSVLETEAVIFTYHYTTHDDKRTITIPIIREDALSNFPKKLEESLDVAAEIYKEKYLGKR
jgi:hypothetical protein